MAKENKIKIVIPLAGTGTRLSPHTFTKPKSMVCIAGKPIIGHILDRMIDIHPEELILVVGYKKEQIIYYIDKNYSKLFNIRYVVQDKQLGLGHSIYVAREFINNTNTNIMIVLGDMLFSYKDYSNFLNVIKCLSDDCSLIGIKEVSDTTKYGIVELKGEYIKRLEEKPVYSMSNLAIAGLYFINDTNILLSILDDNIKSKYFRGEEEEYQLTDALQEMINVGCLFKVFPMTDWFDCGHSESLLKTNKTLLDEKKNIDSISELKNSVIVNPVSIGKNVSIINSVVGPHTSIANDSVIDSSVVSNSIIGTRTLISKVNIQQSIVGDDVNLKGKHDILDIGDSSSMEF